MPTDVRKARQRELLEELGRHIGRFGFSSKPAAQTFYRPFDGGRSAFHLAFIDHADEFDVTADVAVRFDAVEDLANRDDTRLTNAEKKRTATLGAELGNIADGVQRRWTVGPANDLRVVAEGITRCFEDVGLPYLEQFEDPGRAFVALSSNDQPAWLNSPIHGKRCIRALALAVVLDRSDEISELVRGCESFLESRKDPGLSAFRRLAQRITSP